MEWLLRASLQVNSAEFVAPTIAAAGLGLLLPLTGQKNRESSLPELLRAQVAALKLEFIPKRERILIQIVWIFVFVSLAVWACCLVFACKPQQNPLNVAPVFYGLGNYFLAVLFAEVKEVV